MEEDRGAVQYSTVQYSTMQYSTIVHRLCPWYCGTCMGLHCHADIMCHSVVCSVCEPLQCVCMISAHMLSLCTHVQGPAKMSKPKYTYKTVDELMVCKLPNTVYTVRTCTVAYPGLC